MVTAASQTLTALVADAITDYTKLYVRLDINKPTVAPPTTWDTVEALRDVVRGPTVVPDAPVGGTNVTAGSGTLKTAVDAGLANDIFYLDGVYIENTPIVPKNGMQFWKKTGAALAEIKTTTGASRAFNLTNQTGVNDLVFAGLTIHGYSTNGIYLHITQTPKVSSLRATVKYCEIYDIGVGAPGSFLNAVHFGSGDTISSLAEFNIVHDIGETGFNGQGGNVTFDNNEFYSINRNNQNHQGALGRAAAIKCHSADGTIITNNWAHDLDRAPAFWIDATPNAVNCLISGNLVEGSHANDNFPGPAIWFEISGQSNTASAKTVISLNVIRNIKRDAIYLSECRNAHVDTNFIENCYTGITLLEQTARAQTLRDILIEDNKVIQPFYAAPEFISGRANMVTGQVGPGVAAGALATWDWLNNTYEISTSISLPFRLDDDTGKMNSAAWQAHAQTTGETITTF